MKHFEYAENFFLFSVISVIVGVILQLTPTAYIYSLAYVIAFKIAIYVHDESNYSNEYHYRVQLNKFGISDSIGHAVARIGVIISGIICDDLHIAFTNIMLMAIAPAMSYYYVIQLTNKQDDVNRSFVGDRYISLINDRNTFNQCKYNLNPNVYEFYDIELESHEIIKFAIPKSLCPYLYDNMPVNLLENLGGRALTELNTKQLLSKVRTFKITGENKR
jgi:hypothetical protein